MNLSKKEEFIITAIELIDELKIELSIIFSDYSLPNKYGVLQLVKIFTQYLPLPSSITLTNKSQGLKDYESSDYEANFPCVLIRHDGIIDNEERRLEMTTHKVKLMFGVYDEAHECQAWRDLFNMIEQVRQSFLLKRYLADKFRLNMPVNSSLIDAETWPVYFAEMSLIYESGRASMPADFVHKRRL